MLSIISATNGAKAAYVPENSELRTLQPGILTVATYANFYPVAYRQGNVFQGLEVDIMKDVAARQGLSIRFIEASEFEGIWNLPGRGVADVAIGGITWAESRRSRSTEWSCPYFSVSRTLVYNRRLTQIKRFPEEITARVRATPGSTGYDDAYRRMSRAGKLSLLEGSTDEEEDLRLLLNGSVCGLIRGSCVGRALVEKHPDVLAMVNPWDILPELRPTEHGEVFMLPTRAGSGLAKALTRFLRTKATDGSLVALVNKHQLVC